MQSSNSGYVFSKLSEWTISPQVMNPDYWKFPVIVFCLVAHSALVGECLAFFHASAIEILPFESDSSMCFVCSEGYCAD